MKIWMIAAAMLVVALPQAAEARRGGASPAPARHAPAPAAKPAPKPADKAKDAAAAKKPDSNAAASRSGFVFVSTGSIGEKQKEQAQPTPDWLAKRPVAPPAPVQPASASAMAPPQGVPVPMLGQAAAATAPPASFQVLR